VNLRSLYYCNVYLVVAILSFNKVPYILESNPCPNLIHTSFCRFLKRKKKLVRCSNPHVWKDDGEDKDDSDWMTDNDSVMSDDGESDE